MLGTQEMRQTAVGLTVPRSAAAPTATHPQAARPRPCTAAAPQPDLTHVLQSLVNGGVSQGAVGTSPMVKADVISLPPVIWTYLETSEHS